MQSFSSDFQTRDPSWDFQNRHACVKQKFMNDFGVFWKLPQLNHNSRRTCVFFFHFDVSVVAYACFVDDHDQWTRVTSDPCAYDDAFCATVFVAKIGHYGLSPN